MRAVSEIADILQHTDSALILAIKRNRVEAVKCLLEAKAKPDICGAVGNFNY